MSAADNVHRIVLPLMKSIESPGEYRHWKIVEVLLSLFLHNMELLTIYPWTTIVMYQSTDTISLAGRQRCMILVDELFMFLIRLRLGLYEQDLAVL